MRTRTARADQRTSQSRGGPPSADMGRQGQVHQHFPSTLSSLRKASNEIMVSDMEMSDIREMPEEQSRGPSYSPSLVPPHEPRVANPPSPSTTQIFLLSA